jgi:hypothetical protein
VKNTNYILFLDLDGVLVDYNGGWWNITDLLQIKYVEGQDFSKEELRRIGKQIRTSAFWSNLGWENGGEELWTISTELFENVHILTSTAAKSDNEYHKIVSAGKMKWIESHLSGLNRSKVHIVRERAFKSRFASDQSILVDDRKSTVQAFRNAGGIGIVHIARRFENTIVNLKRLANPLNLGEIAKNLPVVKRGFWNGK